MTLNEILTAKGISDAELARLVNITRPHANKLRNGKRGIAPKMAEKLEAVTGVPREQFIFGPRDAA